MKTLSKEQKKIIYISAIVIVSLLFFWVFVYVPQSRKLVAIKGQISDAEAQIAEINRMAEGKELSLAVRDFQSRLNNIESKLPFKKEDVINSLSEAARKLKIDIKNLALSPEQELSNKIPGYDIEEFPISMNLACDYRALGDYLSILRNTFPVLVRIRQVNIQGRGEGQDVLDIELLISAYLNKMGVAK